MRLYCLLLLSFAGLCLGSAHAGELVGDWWQEDSQDSSSSDKRAISQPISRGTADIQATLGVKGKGSAGPVDFFLIVSSNTANDSCLYAVDEVIIDSQSFPVSSPRHRSDIDSIVASTAEAQKRLWQAFIKGQKLSLKVGRTCSGSEQTVKDINTFDFSLKGSSAAYRFVAGLGPPEDRKQTKAADASRVPEPAEIRTIPATEPDTGYPIPLILASIFAIFLLLYFLLRPKPALKDDHVRRESGRFEPQIGVGSQQKEARDSAIETLRIAREAHGEPEPQNILTSAIRQDVADLPQYRVEHVIDGDTVVLSRRWRQIRVRLDAIDCPEDGQEWGDIATAGLIKLIGGKQVHLEEHGTDRYERMLATLYVRNDNGAEWMNVNERMVTLGHAWVMRRFYKHLPPERQNKLNQLERWAKSKKVGLWRAPNPLPPWNWRNGN